MAETNTAAPPAGPLDGIRIVDLSYWVAAPSAAGALAMMGADVIKVENATGDLTRYIGARENGFTGLFEALNRNKRGIALNLRTRAGREVLDGLLAGADILVESFRNDVREGLGLGPATVRERYPRLIHATSTGFGLRGPDVDLPAFDIVAGARSGYLVAQGRDFGVPRRPVAPLGDLVAGKDLVQGILLALWARERTGRGQHVSVSLFASQVLLQSFSLSDYLFDGRRAGSFPHPDGDALSTWYKTQDDGYVAISLLHYRFWPNICAAMGLERLLEEERFGTPFLRRENDTELRAILAERFASKPRDEWLRVLAEHDVPAGAMQDCDEVVRDPQTIANELIVEFDHPRHGRIRQPSSPITLSSTPASIRLPAPQLGEHTAEVLAELGYDEAAAAEIIASGFAA